MRSQAGTRARPGAGEVGWVVLLGDPRCCRGGRMERATMSEHAALGAELMKAMDLGVHILLVHEMPGAGGQEQRFGCEFVDFFSCADGATPDALLMRGIYSESIVAA